MNQLLISTRNLGKLKEFKKILADISFEILSLNDLNIKDEVKESGKSYEENAILKAKTIGEKSKLLTLGEDAGLEIDALGGKPGIYSARFTKGTDEDKIDKILKLLKGVPQEGRTARYKAVIAIYNPQTKEVQTFDGIVEGYITEKREGTNGFGYDPIFWSKDLKKTFGSATDEEKNFVSHRSRALSKLKNFISKIP